MTTAIAVTLGRASSNSPMCPIGSELAVTAAIAVTNSLDLREDSLQYPGTSGKSLLACRPKKLMRSSWLAEHLGGDPLRKIENYIIFLAQLDVLRDFICFAFTKRSFA